MEITLKQDWLKLLGRDDVLDRNKCCCIAFIGLILYTMENHLSNQHEN
jgi:hypothetical protein